MKAPCTTRTATAISASWASSDFLFLILVLLRNWDWKAGRTERPELGDRVWLLSRLNVMALLLATLDRLWQHHRHFIRFIRGYNRISPYIIFFALLTMGLTAEKWLTQRTGKARAAFAAVLAVLLVFGFWEQQGLYNPGSTNPYRRPGSRTRTLWLRSSRRQGRTL